MWGFFFFFLHVMGWFSRQVAAGCGSEFCFHTWAGHCPFVWPVSRDIDGVLSLALEQAFSCW